MTNTWNKRQRMPILDFKDQLYAVYKRDPYIKGY